MKKTVVLADDYEMTRWLLKQTLNSFDIQIEMLNASDGQTALNFFDGRKIDLLITDYNMPRMNGLQLIKNVLDQPFYSDIPTILLTGNKSAASEIKDKLPENSTLMLKPYKLPDLKENIQKFLNL